MYSNHASVLRSTLEAMLEEVPVVEVTWSAAVSASPIDDYGQPARLSLTPSGGQAVVFQWFDGLDRLAEALSITLKRVRSLTVYRQGDQLAVLNVQSY